MRLHLGLAVLAATALAACETGPKHLYAWPSYDASVLAVCSEFENIDLPKHLETLAKQVEKLEQSDHKVPPGVHAHLGYLYSLVGDQASARRELEEEARLFPESAVFVEGLLKRMRS